MTRTSNILLTSLRSTWLSVVLLLCILPQMIIIYITDVPFNYDLFTYIYDQMPTIINNISMPKMFANSSSTVSFNPLIYYLQCALLSSAWWCKFIVNIVTYYTTKEMQLHQRELIQGGVESKALKLNISKYILSFFLMSVANTCSTSISKFARSKLRTDFYRKQNEHYNQMKENHNLTCNECIYSRQIFNAMGMLSAIDDTFGSTIIMAIAYTNQVYSILKQDNIKTSYILYGIVIFAIGMGLILLHFDNCHQERPNTDMEECDIALGCATPKTNLLVRIIHACADLKEETMQSIYVTEYQTLLAILYILIAYISPKTVVPLLFVLDPCIEYIFNTCSQFYSIYESSAKWNRFIEDKKKLHTESLDKRELVDVIEIKSIDSNVNICPYSYNLQGSLKIHKGENWLITGQSGIGKTSILKALQDSSCVLKLDSDIPCLHYVHHMVEYDQKMKETMSRYNISARQLLRDIDEEHIEEYCKIACFPMNDLTQPVSTMSGGERTRLCLIRTLHELELKGNQFLLLDEPEQGLNIELITPIMTNIFNNEKYKNTTIVIVSHVPDLSTIVKFNKELQFVHSENDDKCVDVLVKELC